MDAWMSVLLIHGQAHAVKGTNVEQKFAPSSKICVLKTNSAKRCEESKDFVKLGKKIARYEDQKNRKSISLNEKVFMAEWAEINADKEQEKEMEEINDPNRPVFDTDSFYSKEIVAVTLDYIRALQGGLAPATVGQK